MTPYYLGIDVSKKKLDCALVVGDKVLDKTCENSPKGFVALGDWLAKRGVELAHACVEATGGLEEAVATALFEAGHHVSVLNPASIHAFAQQRLTRSKTDRIDARTIAEFARRHHDDLRLWEPPPKELTELRDLVNRRQALVEMKTQEINRLKCASGGPVVDEMVQRHVDFLDREIAVVEAAIKDHIDKHPGLRAQRELLVSIPGVSDQTAALFLGEVAEKLAWMTSAKQLVCYAGLDVRRRESGSSVRGRPRSSKFGNRRLRTALFFPAMTALRFNPIIVAADKRLQVENRPYKVRLIAAMRRLLHQMFGVLKHSRPFDPTLART